MASIKLLLFLSSYYLASGETPDPRLQLWPLPLSYSFSDPMIPSYSKNFQFIGDGAGGQSSILKAAFRRYKDYNFDQGEATSEEGLQGLVVYVASNDETLNLDTDESYTLSIDSTSTKTTAIVNAQTVYGALRGMETFSQIIFFDGTQYYVPKTSIKDSPRFSHRGFMIDTARHFVEMDIILKFIEAMSFNKFNVLHWHIVDDQSFPYESTTYPSLSEKGAYDQNHVYSQKDISTVIQYAKERGIRVIPEFDTPGHTLAWGLGIPGLSTACYDNSTQKPTGQYGPIDPTNENNWVFMTNLLRELAGVFPDQYIHLGGDEVSFSCWSTNPAIQKWMIEHNISGRYDQLEQYYETRLLAIAENETDSYIVWEEIFDNGLKVKPDTVIEVWKSSQAHLGNITKAGFRGIFSTCWYLNYISYGQDWIKYYKCDPLDFNGTESQKKLVVGGEGCLWAEYVDGTNLISRAWPRAGAVAERLWSQQNVTDVEDAAERLHNQRCRMVRRGIEAEPFNGPSFCPTVYKEGKWNNSFRI